MLSAQWALLKVTHIRDIQAGKADADGTEELTLLARQRLSGVQLQLISQPPPPKPLNRQLTILLRCNLMFLFHHHLQLNLFSQYSSASMTAYNNSGSGTALPVGGSGLPRRTLRTA